MASTFKTFVSDDIANTRTLLHESIPITGSIVNKTTYTSDENIKKYGHGMFQSVYDYPYQSSSANHIFDIAYGTSPVIQSTEVANEQVIAANDFSDKRINVYNQMAQVLVGHDVNGSIRKFDADGDLTGGTKHDNLFFLNFARLLGKDEIKKGTFSMEVGVDPAFATPFTETAMITDTGAATNYKVNSPAGEYGILKIANTGTDNQVQTTGEDANCGLIFYQAGIVAINPLVFDSGSDGALSGFLTANCNFADASTLLEASLESETLTNDQLALGLRNRIRNIQFSNTTELNSTIYFCRIGHNDFNYSSNPTYLENSKIRVKNKTTDAPVSYVTTVGLYSADNEMLAVAKLSEPLRKDPTNDMTLRVRLDY